MEEKLLTLIEVISTNLVKLVETQQEIYERLDRNDLQLAKLIDDNSRAMATILEHVVETTSRTERMTGEILMRLANQPHS